MQAQKIFQRIQTDLQTIDDQIRNHSFLDALDRKEVSEEALRSVPGHQYHIIISNIRADANLLQRFGGTRFRDYFFGVLQSRMAAYPVLLTMASKLGMGQADLEHFEVDPDASGRVPDSGLQLLCIEGRDGRSVVADQRTNQRVKKRTVVEISPQRHQHQDRTPNIVDQFYKCIEKPITQLRLGDSEQLLALVDHPQPLPFQRTDESHS